MTLHEPPLYPNPDYIGERIVSLILFHLRTGIHTAMTGSKFGGYEKYRDGCDVTDRSAECDGLMHCHKIQGRGSDLE